LTPRGQRSGTSILEPKVRGAKFGRLMSVLSWLTRRSQSELVVDLAMDCDKFLQASHLPEPEHRSLPSSKWLVRVLGAVVQPTADFAFVDGTELLQCGTVGCQSILDDRVNQAMPSE
jgi:hypothetical protein